MNYVLHGDLVTLRVVSFIWLCIQYGICGLALGLIVGWKTKDKLFKAPATKGIKRRKG